MMQQIKKIGIIDDDPSSLDILENYTDGLPHFELSFRIQDPHLVNGFLKKEKPDILVMDVCMPSYSGLALLEDTREFQIPTILISAFKEYAFDSIELEAVDFLYKPFSLSRYRKALNKSLRSLKKAAESTKPKDLVVQVQRGKYIKVKIKSILYLKGSHSYTEIITKKSKHLSSLPLSFYEEHLRNHGFVRIHRSHIVNGHKVLGKQPDAILLDKGVKLPIGLLYRQNVQALFFDNIP
ncbi:LytTR family DNA-binding domain-containing protein [Echinicola marina]|uniref:LytR/AlgR family response regulator transcription factor n=1 Tax=Echinicola marina TaxID=2859768 RepID=UPI001CF64DD5|nr:LytTR family DNA-binding domain-containing protein [Echinicola marina]UCS95050.1 LytTR family DNA-binding domain-containing protein [Echinicola marina]